MRQKWRRVLIKNGQRRILRSLSQQTKARKQRTGMEWIFKETVRPVTLVVGDAAVRYMSGKTVKTYWSPSAMDWDVEEKIPQLTSEHSKINQIILHVGANNSDHWTFMALTNWKPSCLLVNYCQRSTEGPTGSTDFSLFWRCSVFSSWPPPKQIWS